MSEPSAAPHSLGSSCGHFRDSVFRNRVDVRSSDIATYGLGLNNANILAGIGFGTGKTKGESLYNTAVGGTIVSIFVSSNDVARSQLPRVFFRVLLITPSRVLPVLASVYSFLI